MRSLPKTVKAFLLGAMMTSIASAQTSIDLSGDWNFRLDPNNVGMKERWQSAPLPDKLQLPGSLQAQGFGYDISVDTPWIGSRNDKSWYTDPRYEPYRQPGKTKVTFWLTPGKHYVGAAWYGKMVNVPESWRERRIVLSLERCHWETTLFVDGEEIGKRDSLTTAHEYDLTDALTPGQHALTLRVDNSMIVNVGIDAHSMTDHTQTDWNGIIGKLELRAQPRAWVDDVQVYPNVRNKSVRVETTLRSSTGRPMRGNVTLKVGDLKKQVAVDLSGQEQKVRIDLPLGPDAKLWDEFSPNLYTAEVSLDAGNEKDTKTVTFGLRELGQEGTQLTINGRKMFVRGTLECCSFPLTGYPDTDVASWKKIIGVCKEYGLNSIRFHSWCPPETAFVAADELGFYFQVEGPAWANVDDPKFQAFDRAECDRILKAYGNHPSFCFLTYGNEPAGKKQKEFFVPLVEHWKQIDPRHKYTCASGWPLLDVNDFQMTPDPRVQRWGEGLKSRINALPPATTANYVHGFVDKWPMPVITHEMGQWCVYPDFKEIAKYTGFLKAGNFEIFRDSLKSHHMLDQAEDFLRASGKLQALCYKEDIEATLRTPGFGGFQLLGLQDFPGQGTALVGVLNVFWQDKGYIKGPEFRRFCAETVPLAEMDKRVFTNNENFTATVRIAHFGPKALAQAKPVWNLKGDAGEVIASGSLPVQDIPVGNDAVLGKVAVPLQSVARATKLVFTVSLEGTPFANDWDIWVYPAALSADAPADVKITDDPQEAARILASGGKALLALPAGRVKGDPQRGPVGLGFSSIFWNTAWTSYQPPHTLGILCNPAHPALADFPTEDHTNWQWWYLVHDTRPMILDSLPADLKPIVQVIDDWVTNRKLALAFEAKVGSGKLLMTTINLDPASNPVARQLRASFLHYMNSQQFNPAQTLAIEQVEGLTKPASLYQRLGATIHADSEQSGYEAENLLDEESPVIWHTNWSGKPAPYPHQFVIELATPAKISGFKALPRQDGNTNGWIRSYEIQVSDDGKHWAAPVARGEFPRNADWKTIRLDHPVQARFIRFVALAPWGDKPYASLARFELIPE